MAAYGRRLRLRLFLEGIEVPIIAANIQTAPNSPTVASLQIPPLAEGTRLLPRTLVHLFFLDEYAAKLPELSSEGAITTSPEKEPEPTKHQRNVDRQRASERDLINDLADDEEGSASGSAPVPDLKSLSEYRVLFAGEMIGFVWNKSQASRALVLQCQDFSNYWDYAYQYSNTGIFGPGRKALFSGGATNMHTDFLRSKGSIITEILARGRCNSFPDLHGLAAGIIKLLEVIGGTYYPSPRSNNMKRIRGQNLFFSIAELRLHITHTLAAFENDPTTQRMLRRGGWTGLFNRRLGGLGKQTSFRKAVNAIQSVIFHEMYAQPSPFYKPGKFLEPTKKIVRFKNTGVGSIAAEVVKIIRRLLKKVKGLSQTTITGSGGTKFVRPAGFVKDEITKIARITLDLQALITGMILQARKAGKRAEALQSTASSLIIEASGLAVFAIDNIKRKRYVTNLNRILALMRKLSSGQFTKIVPPSKEPPRLNQHIFRPDIWFGSPPRCNILFPEDYDYLSYQRMFLQEPTRLLLKTNDEFFGEDSLFDKLYFAPATTSVKRNKVRIRDIKRGDLLSHEILTGILPVFQKSGEFNIFASRGSVKRNTPSYKDGYAQRAANFLYFKFRFNARQMRIGGKFNPYVVPGFPGLVIDRYIDIPTLLLHNELKKAVNEGRKTGDKGEIPLQDISQALGTNFLGNFTEISHNVSQEATTGRTEITCSYPRQPDESVEFLGKEDMAENVLVDVKDDAVRASAVAAYNPPKLFSLGPNGGQITAVTDVSQTYAPTRVNVDEFNERFALSQKLPLFRAKKKREGRVQKVEVPIGIPVTARQLNSPDVQDITGSLDREIIFRAFQIEERIPRFRRERVNKPMEDLIHPGWYGDIWRPTNIGKVYQDFFGIGSINDPQAVGFTSEPIPQDEASAQAAEAGELAESAEDPRADLISNLALREGSSIQDAVDFLVLSYSFVRQNGLNVDEFTRSYTWRPIANMLDIFGTTDLRFSEDGEKVIAGVEGFHSRAFGPYDNLFGLVSPEIKSILGITRNTTAAQRADTRGRKMKQVQQLVAALTFSRGLLG